MNIFKGASAAVLLLSSLSTFASTITTDFMSGIDDGCTSCTLTNQSVNTWLDPTGTVLDGASWIQSSSVWQLAGDYMVYEMDLGPSVLTSLYVAFDDTLIIKVGDDTLFNSTTESISNSWNTVTDVFDYIDVTYIGEGDSLDFYVTNTGIPGEVTGPTGVIWSGEVERDSTSVPEPSMVFALGLGLLTFGFTRRKNKNL